VVPAVTVGEDRQERLAVRLLGPLRAFVGEREVPLGPPQQRALFAVLAVRRGQVVTPGELIDAIWGEELPGRPEGGVHTYVAGLRRALEPGRPRRSPGRHLHSAPAGYRLALAREDSDLDRFERLRDAGRRAWRERRPAAAGRLIDDALALFDGTALGGVPGPYAETQRAWLAEQRRSLAEDRTDLLLALGLHRAAVDASRALTAEQPLRERPWSQLMLALYREGRQSEALAAYEQARRASVEALGLDPGPLLGELRRRILAADPGLLGEGASAGPAAGWRERAETAEDPGPVRRVRANAGEARGGADPGPERTAGPGGEPVAGAERPAWPADAGPATTARPLPATGPQPPDRRPDVGERRFDLPRDADHFQGRARELARIVAAADRGVCAIDGMAGVGKTALAVHAARLLAARYPDLRLHIDLHGHTPGREPVGAGAALESLLLAAGVPGDRIPAGTDDRAALWRARLAGRRALVVLDNAVDAGQVRPLLSGSPRSLVLITSRRRLSGLDSGESLSLDVLPPADAAALFAAGAGPERAAAEPEAAGDVVRACGMLPLAVRIAAARLRHRPGWSVAHLRDRLADQERRLEELTAEDRSVSAAFALSYRSLDAEHRRAFRLLGLFPGTEIGLPAAAALAGTGTVAEADRLLEGLVDCQLLAEPRPGRYRLHDLLRVYAARECERTEDEAQRRTALGRLLDHYLATADLAEEHLRPQRLDRADAAPAGAGTAFADRAAALDWLDAERATFAPLIEAAARAGHHRHAWQLARCLWGFLESRGHWADWLACHELALPSARLLGDRLAEARLLVGLGVARHALRQYGAAVGHYRAALALMRETGFRAGEAGVLTNLGNTLRRLGRLPESIECHEQSLRTCREVGDQAGEAIALANLGELYRDAGRTAQSVAVQEQALAMFAKWGELRLEGSVLDGLARTHLAVGHISQALAHAREALDRRRSSGDRTGEAQTLDLLGTIHLAARAPARAADFWRRALALAPEVDPTLAAELRAKLGEMRAGS
jgi:DNA-binding SARP family transcriptional activator